MPIYVVDNATPATKIFESKVWTRIHVLVLDANTLFLSNDKRALENLGAGGLQQGLALTKAMNVVTLPWIGECWAFGSAVNTVVDIEIMLPPGAGAGS